ncbi:hypothetical protein TSUD_292460 [Trifolium subterraneum]|uniref:Uncharacterized protein n=1 Tax=Trifolium subterraneum TaxID=3900 RepID=A0A2Z6N1G4_TRISU|nr:hypothetical protein TSUD_292460 [Trifolium subterraneum]
MVLESKSLPWNCGHMNLVSVGQILDCGVYKAMFDILLCIIFWTRKLVFKSQAGIDRGVADLLSNLPRRLHCCLLLAWRGAT